MSREKKQKSLEDHFGSAPLFSWGILLAILCLFMVMLYPSLIVKKQPYELGDIAKRDIKASEDFFVEDKDATEANRKIAAENVLTVYDMDLLIHKETIQRVTSAFEELRRLFNEEEKRKQKAIEAQLSTAADALAEESTDAEPLTESKDFVPIPTAAEIALKQKQAFEDKIKIKVSSGAYNVLIEHGFSAKIPEFISTILTQILQNGVVANKDILLREAEKGITIRNIETKTEKHILNLKQFFGPDQAKTMVRVTGDPLLKNLNYALLNLIVDFSQRLMHPNITLNRNETEERKKKASAMIKPVLYKIKAGEMLLREGERVTQVKRLKINTLNEQSKDPRIVVSGTGAALIMAAILIIQFFVYTRAISFDRANFQRNLLFLASTLISFIIAIKASSTISSSWTLGAMLPETVSSMGYGIPLAAGAMTVCLFLGFETAVTFGFVCAVFAAMLLQNRFETFIYFYLSSTMAAWWVRHCRERKVIIKAGAKLGGLNILLCIAMNVYLGDSSLVKLSFDMVFAFLGGLGAGVVAVGIAPLVEMTFHYSTDITLLELSNLDRPILRRLMLEAPGTYHHSVIVGSMVEAAASEIGANPLLAKVCGYYHDIGKLKQPLYFIENQKDGKNKHDKLAPSMSSLILIAHVKNGVETAKKHKLGQGIIDTIQQHHGTSLISYFYEKARQLRGEDAVNIDDFRYPGPKPQSIETALVMLADVVEAASRTLDNPTPARIQGLVQTLINKIFSDGQLDDCELTLKDLHNIAKSFNKILNGIHHHRIEYQENLSVTHRKRKNGNSDRQQTKQSKNTNGKSSEKNARHLKRLGLS